MTAKDRLDTILENVWHDGQGHTAKGLVAAVDEAKQAIQADLFGLLELVRSIPSDDPQFMYWQGYHQAQVDISKKISEYTGGK